MPMLTVPPTARPSTSAAASSKAQPDALGDGEAFLATRVVEHDGEFLAAQPADQVGGSELAGWRSPANTCSTRSPTAWPKRSLIDLK